MSDSTPAHVRAILEFVPATSGLLQSFYLSALRKAGYGVALTAAEFLDGSPALNRLIDRIYQARDEEPHRYLDVVQSALTDAPKSAYVLLAIGGTAMVPTQRLAAFAAVREMALKLLTTKARNGWNDHTELAVSEIASMEILRELVRLGMDRGFMAELTRMEAASPLLRVYLRTTALEVAAVMDVADGQTNNGHMFSFARTIVELESKSSGVDLGLTIEMADLVHLYRLHGLQNKSVRAGIVALQPRADEPAVEDLMDRYLVIDDVVEDLFDMICPPPDLASAPTAPVGSPMKDLHRILDRQTFTSDEELDAFLNSLMEGPVPTIDESDLTDEERCEDAVEAVQSLPAHERPAVLQDLAERYPDSMWPWLGLAGTAESPEEQQAFALQGLARGKHFADPTFANEHLGSYYMVRAARPYVWLQESLAQGLDFGGRLQDAIDAYEYLFRIENGTVPAHGPRVLALLLRRGQRQHLDRAEVLAAQIGEDREAQACSIWNKVLLAMIRNRSQQDVHATLVEAMRDIPWVGYMIAGFHPTEVHHPGVPYIDQQMQDLLARAFPIAQLAWSTHQDEARRLKKMIASLPL